PPANLWKPADDPAGHDYTAHGSFDGESKPRSAQLWASQHHGLLGGAVLGLAGAAAAAILGRRGRR
ncbi:MAG TPA: short-chain dehydrogenase, partial [Streptosporangiaceae bacterium]